MLRIDLLRHLYIYIVCALSKAHSIMLYAVNYLMDDD